MHTNVLGAMRVLPQVAEALAPGAALAVISSRMGSIALRAAPAGWLYRASKAALNSVLKDVSLVLAGRAVCVALHPGWVRTDMGGGGADLEVADSVAAMRRTLAALGAADNGRFLNFDGRRWPGSDWRRALTMLLSEDHLAVQDAVRALRAGRDRPARRGLGQVAPLSRRRSSRAWPRSAATASRCPPNGAVPGSTTWRWPLILEEIAAGDGATSTVVSVNNCPVCSILMAFGNDEQKRRFLKPLARGEMLGAFCLTEPHVGSEAGGLKTTARRERRPLRAQRRQAVHHQRQERRRRDRDGGHRQGRRQEGHQRLHRADRHARLHGRAPRRQDGPARQRHRADHVRELPRAGRQPAGRRRHGAEDRAVGPGRRAHRHRQPGASAWRARPSRRRWPTARSA